MMVLLLTDWLLPIAGCVAIVLGASKITEIVMDEMDKRR